MANEISILTSDGSASNLYPDREQAILASQDFARRARQRVDPDEPQIDSLTTFLLLSQLAFQSGKGKRAYMYLCK